MRLKKLQDGHTRKQKAVMWLARKFLGTIPGPILTMSYRPELFGRSMAASLHESMREASQFTTAETELMSAFVSRLNSCRY